MPANLAIDDRLLEEARKIGGKRTKRETVNDALRSVFVRVVAPSGQVPRIFHSQLNNALEPAFIMHLSAIEIRHSSI